MWSRQRKRSHSVFKMHFRLYRDVELGMGSWRTRDDFLGLQLDNNNNRDPSSTSSTATTTVANNGVSSPNLENDKVEDESLRQYPKRVSLTVEDGESMAPSETSSVDGDETPEEGNGDATSPLRVAEILRQLSQASSPKAAEAPDLTSTTTSNSTRIAAENKKTATIEREAFRKRSVPPTFTGCAAQGPKRVRWMAPANLPAPPAAATAARFFHHRPQGITAMSMALSHHQLPTVPVLKPIPGLEAYDVLVGRDFISHFNLGNRRLLVLAFSHLDKFIASTPTAAKTTDGRQQQQVIVESMYNTIRAAGGRFVEMVGQRGGFEEMSSFDAKLAIANVLRKQAEHYRSGKGLIRMFQRDCSSIWGNVQEDAELSAGPTEQVDRPLQPPVDESYDSVDEDTSDDEKERTYRKAVKKFEPMTPLAVDFEPGQYDVICSRGSLPKKHPGNIWFVSLVEQNCERYIQAEGKMAKSIIVSEILDIVRKNSPGGGFVKMDDDGRWCETGDHLAREKIGQCFRDRLHTRYSSSSKAKLEKRRSSKCDTGSVGSMDKEDESN